MAAGSAVDQIIINAAGCSSSLQVRQYLQQGLRVRRLLGRRANAPGGPTTFFDFRLEARDSDNPHTIRQSSFRFVQIAGTGGQSATFDPGLQCLHKCVKALAEKKESYEVPFRDSSLTRLLQAGLGGNASTLLVASVDPQESKGADTAATLIVARQMKHVTCAPMVNKNCVGTAIAELRAEIKIARGRLNLEKPGQYLQDIDPALILHLKKLLGDLECMKADTWENRQKRSSELEEQRIQNLREEGMSVVLAQAVEVPVEQTSKAQSILKEIVSKMVRVQ